MRIEISAGGLSAGIAVAKYQADMASFDSDTEGIISSFKTVYQKACNLSGGIGTLRDAVGELSERIQEEEARKEAASTVRKKTNDFLELTIRVDKQVASLVNKNKDEFYQMNPWLKPAVATDDAPWYEKAWDWLCDKGEKFADDVKGALTWVADTTKKAWNGLVEFYNEHKHLCQILIGVAAIAAAVVVTVVTGGAALPALLAMAKTAITAGLISAATGGALSAVVTLLSGEELETALKNALSSAVDGFCSGFMWGGILAGVSQIVTCLKPGTLKKATSHREQMEINRKTGAEYDDKCYNTFKKQYTDSQRQITIETSNGTRTRVDQIGLDKNGNVVIHEIKASGTAPLTKNQAMAFPEIFESGGVVKGAGKGIFSNGFVIPPGTKVTIIRPSIASKIVVPQFSNLLSWTGGFLGQIKANPQEATAQ